MMEWPVGKRKEEREKGRKTYMKGRRKEKELGLNR